MSASRIKRVEYDRGFNGWIARHKDGTEIAKGFRWATRLAARTVVHEADCLAERPVPAAAPAADGGRA